MLKLYYYSDVEAMIMYTTLHLLNIMNPGKLLF